MMKFKVGDRVEYIGNDPLDPLSYGDKGRVIACCEYRTYYVEWDKRNLMMHNGDGNGRNYHCWCVRECEIRKVKEEKKMENVKSILKTGMIVVRRDGKEEIVLNNFNGTSCNIIAGNGGWHSFDNYKDDLTNKYFIDFDIVEVKKIKKYNCSCTIPLWIKGNYREVEYETIWKREEPKEMTVSEIEKELGYKIKVITDKEEHK